MCPKSFIRSAGALLVLLSAAPADPHHSFAAEFDSKAPVSLSGKVTKVEWINPHAWIHLDVVAADGSVVGRFAVSIEPVNRL